jgi:hypothetical protein
MITLGPKRLFADRVFLCMGVNTTIPSGIGVKTVEWLQLTTLDERPILIDATSILHVRPHENGSRITLSQPTLGEKSKPSLESVVVLEQIPLLSKMLKAKISKLPIRSR